MTWSSVLTKVRQHFTVGTSLLVLLVSMGVPNQVAAQQHKPAATSLTAAANEPTLAGSYMIDWSEICITELGVVGDPLTGLSVPFNGLIRQGLGTITFTPSADDPLTGTYVAKGLEAQGSTALIQEVQGGKYTGNLISSPAAVTFTGPFTVTPGHLTLGTIINGQPGETFVFFTEFTPATGPTTHLELLRQGQAGCTLRFSAWVK